MTLPTGIVALKPGVIVPSASPAAVMAVRAAACVFPTTLGTAIAGPSDTTPDTPLPTLTTDPALGLWLMSTPAAMVLLNSVEETLNTSCAAVQFAVAAACVSPTTFGTVIGGPSETTTETCVPLGTEVPAAGLWLMTALLGTVVLNCSVGFGVRPAAVSSLNAADSGSPPNAGTLTWSLPEPPPQPDAIRKRRGSTIRFKYPRAPIASIA